MHIDSCILRKMNQFAPNIFTVFTFVFPRESLHYFCKGHKRCFIQGPYGCVIHQIFALRHSIVTSGNYTESIYLNQSFCVKIYDQLLDQSELDVQRKNDLISLKLSFFLYISNSTWSYFCSWIYFCGYKFLLTKYCFQRLAFCL